MTTLSTTVCSTHGCANRADVEPVALGGRWWEPVANPAPFCDKCKAGQQEPKK